MRHFIILTEGYTRPNAAKTAINLLRYRPTDVVALLDRTHRGRTTQELLGVGGSTPIVAGLDQAPGANTLVLGVAFSGGRLPAQWRKTILESIARGMDVVSGLHELLTNDPSFASAAARSGARLIDLRHNNERRVASRIGIRERCLRVHTVGQDCCVGKMVVAMELTRALLTRGYDAKFVATGQTGMLIEGDGCAIDSVVADFVSGAAEQLVLSNQQHEFLLIEGQGSISHPRYSAVTLGLLHGCAPQGMILCYEVGRAAVIGMPHVQLRPLSELLRIYETMANVISPSRVIGVAMNSRTLTSDEAAVERERISAQFGLPVCDVLREGPDELVHAVLKLRNQPPVR